ncbi:MAG: aldehyde dehydrogenase family protein [Polyangiales bacterium]
MLTLEHCIDGAMVAGTSGRVIDLYEPATGRLYGHAPDADDATLDRAVAARRRPSSWSKVGAGERSRLLAARRPRGARPRRDGPRRVHRHGQARARRAPSTSPRRRQPPLLRGGRDAVRERGPRGRRRLDPLHPALALGVVGCISPWNLPLYLFTWKIAPALAAGNTVVAKPSEVTPVTAERLARLAIEAGFPPGVLNVLHGTGPGLGRALVGHPKVKAISFTGSTRAGEDIAARAAPRFKKLSLELGGRTPPSSSTTPTSTPRCRARCARASRTGQICLCGSRILVQRGVYERFVEALRAKVDALRVGDPRDEATEQGAVVSKEHLAKVLGCVEVARAEGAEVLTGGGRATVSGRCSEDGSCSRRSSRGSRASAARTRRRSSARWRR